MAIYNEILAGRFARGLQKLFGTKGSVPTKQLAGEIMAIHRFESGAENRFHEGWSLYGFEGFLAANAGTFGEHLLRNPANSGVVAVVHKLGSPPNGQAASLLTFSFGAVTADLGSVISLANTTFDTRTGTKNPAMIYSQQNAGAQGNLSDVIAVVDQTGHAIQDLIIHPYQEIPVLPGFGIQASMDTANLNSRAFFWWRERALEESELK